MTYCDCQDYCEWCHPELCFPEFALLHNTKQELRKKQLTCLLCSSKVGSMETLNYATLNRFQHEMVTVAKMQELIGRRAFVRFEDLQVVCILSDAKSVYGQIRVLVTPLTGSGSQWVGLQRVTELNT